MCIDYDFGPACQEGILLALCYQVWSYTNWVYVGGNGEKTNHTQVTSPRVSPKKTSQKRPKDLVSRRLGFTPAERTRNLHHRQSRFWPISFASHVTLRWRINLYFRREQETGKHRLRTCSCVNSANTLSKHSKNTRPPWGTPGKDPAWKQEWQSSATAPPCEQRGRAGGQLFWEKSGHIHESKKVTARDQAWWPRSPSKSNYVSVLPLNKRIWDCDSQSLQQVYVPLTPHLALVFPAHIKIKYSHLLNELGLFLLLYNIHILHVY